MEPDLIESVARATPISELDYGYIGIGRAHLCALESNAADNPPTSRSRCAFAPLPAPALTHRFPPPHSVLISDDYHAGGKRVRANWQLPRAGTRSPYHRG